MNNKKLMTLCMLVKPPKLLLGMKKRGFGVGRWNGFGGKVGEGETIEDAAKREVSEEVGVEPIDLQKMGIIDFEFENDNKKLEVHIFKVSDFKGEPKETEEMSPKWFDFSHIPYDQMWSDDIYWIPIFLENKKFKGKFLFDRPSDAEYAAKIIEKSVDVVKTL